MGRRRFYSCISLEFGVRIADGVQPIILLPRDDTQGRTGFGPAGNQPFTAPVAGFAAVILDESQLLAMGQNRKALRSSVAIWSKRPVETYDFEFPTNRTDSSQVDAGVTPKYQFHLEVERDIFPADGIRPDAQNCFGRENPLRLQNHG